MPLIEAFRKRDNAKVLIPAHWIGHPRFGLPYSVTEVAVSDTASATEVPASVASLPIPAADTPADAAPPASRAGRKSSEKEEA